MRLGLEVPHCLIPSKRRVRNCLLRFMFPFPERGSVPRSTRLPSARDPGMQTAVWIKIGLNDHK